MSFQSPNRRAPNAPEDARRPAARTAEGPLFEEPVAPAATPEKALDKPPSTFTVSAILDGYPLTVSFAGSADILPAVVARLRALGATPPSTKLEWSYTPEGLPICPKHGTPMKKREKQGDTWYSHVAVDAHGEDQYCRGYHGKDSPGYEC